MKKILTLALLLTLFGLIVFSFAMIKIDWNFKSLSNNEYQTRGYMISESFDDISIVTDTADVIFNISEADETKVVLYEEIKANYEVSFDDGVLYIDARDNRKWYEKIGFFFDSPKINVFLPAGDYKALEIKSDTGSVDIAKGLNFDSILIKSDTGDVHLEETIANSLDLKTSTGDITLLQTTVGEKVSVKASTGNVSLKNSLADKIFIETSTGDVFFDGSDAEEIFVETSTGNVSGTLLSDKVFVVESDTGRISVPKTVEGGRCEIETNTGDIKIKIKN